MRIDRAARNNWYFEIPASASAVMRTNGRWSSSNRSLAACSRCLAKAGGRTVSPFVLGHQTNLHVPESSALYLSPPSHLRYDR
ncbi:hypothetical protein SCLCIDRAFT_1220948 [Scleroderma citrinum Foug A]|uniref:Uncharacterized protein n=1 Tax=Scleroderma citrinum Foug A TaxID=1036808 RepID=A0A0C3DHE6_9AGAM|nr:hypothetical protein SCLCIDRAFT_1220948 [Scleroderma citrinum Foug A]